MDRSPEFQAHQGLTLYFLGKLHSGLKKLSAYYRQRGVKVFNITTPEELERALSLARPHALVIDLQSRSDITSFFDVLGQYEGLLELPRVAIISSTTDKDTAEALMAQADESVVWPLKATDLSLKLFNLLTSRAQFVKFSRDVRDEEGRFYRGEFYPGFLRDVVQLLYLGRKDAILSLESEGRRGNLYFKEGKLIDAQVGALEWEDSLSLIRRFRSGSFVLSFQPVDRKRFIEKNVAAWLAEQVDEEGEPVAVPEPGEATAIGAPSEPSSITTAPGRRSLSEETTAEFESTGSIPNESVAGAAAVAGAAVVAGAAAASSTPAASSAAGGDAARAGRDFPADPMTTVPPPAGANRAPLSSRPATPPKIEPSRPPEPPVETARPRPVAPPPGPATPEAAPEQKGRDVKVAVGLLVLVVAVLGLIMLLRSQPETPVQVTEVVATPVSVQPTPQPPPPTPLAAKTGGTVVELPPPEVIPAAPQSEVKIREVPPTPLATPTPGKVREVAPTPAPQGVAKITPVKPESTPKPETVVQSTPAPVATPVPTPTPAPQAVAMREPQRTTEPAEIEPIRERPERNLKKARELEKAGKLQEALAVYTQIAELDPSSREASEAIARLKGQPEINPTEPGELHINAYPYGLVFVDGEKQGYTPVHMMKATPRKYLIRVVREDLGACSTEVVIKPGERRWVHLRFDDESCQRTRTP